MEGTKLVQLAAVAATVGVMMMAKVVVGRVYTVGGEEEWSSEANYERWGNKYNFSVGDVLVFRYVKGEHNVYEVREEAYRRCEASGGDEVIAHYSSGEDEVELREGRKYWFICNVAGHCLGGMRFAILVHNLTAPPASAAFTIPPPPPPSPNSSPSIPFSIPLFTIIPILHLLLFSINRAFLIIVSLLPSLTFSQKIWALLP